MKKFLRIFAFSFVAVLTIGLTAVMAQSFKGTILGKITDANNASVAGATVTVTQEGTNFVQTATTNDSGEYLLTQLAPGNYTLKIEAANFKTVVNDKLVLETQQQLRFDAALEAGNISETVTVQDTPSAINTDTSSKGEVITQKQVQDLPLNGRNFTDLALLTPGVYRRPADDDQGEGLATAGTRTDASNYILDGTVNRSDRNGSVGVNTSVDSIREFKVETSTYSAEFGRNAGAQINVVSKSGTNQFHGSLFDYVRNNVFDAKNALAYDVPGTPQDESKKTLIRNQFGATFGGPLPFFNFGEGGRAFDSGKDKTFFFVSYEGTREKRSKTTVTTAPNAAWLRGDFRNVRGAGRDGILGNSDDTNRVLCLTTAGAQVECPTPNVIPLVADPTRPTLLAANSTSLKILTRIPAANLNLADYAITLPGITNRNQSLVKIDRKFTDNNSAYFRYARQSGDGYDPFPSARNFYPTFGRDTTQNYQNYVVSDTNIFTPKFINEFRFGFYTQKSQNLGQNRDTDYIALFSIPGLPSATGENNQGYPAIRIDGFSELGDRPNDPFVYNIRNFQFYDSVSAVAGNHSLKFGVDLIRSNYVEADVRNIRGDFRFRGRNTNPSGSTSSGFYSFADFLYGLPDATQRQIGTDPANLTGWQYAAYVQDNWRVRNWLTLNLGLRYELQTPLTEKTGRLANFIPELGTSVVSGDPRYPKGLIETDKNNLGPRAGFAMRPFKDDKTVIRGGAGIYYSLETFNPIRQQLAVTYPFIQRETYSRLSSNRLLLSFQNPYPGGRGATAGITTPLGLQVNYKTPEIYQYNLTLEREIVKDLVVELGYVGSQGRFLGIRYNLNTAYPTSAVTATTTGGVTTYTPVTARLYPAFGDIQYQAQIAKSNYNGFQTSLRRRQANGLTLLVSYTFSKALDTASSTNNSTTGTQKFPQDVRNLNAERARSDFDRTHQFTTSFNYELPFGKGKTFFRDSRGIGQTLFGGWQLNGVVTLLSGRPFTPQYTTADLSNQRPDIVGDPYANIPAGFAFNPAAFTRPVASPSEPNLFGNAGRNILEGPGFNSTDLSILKNIRATEKTRVQLRFETFNVFNHPNFQVPVFTLDDLNVGKYTTTANEGRELQFALKILF